MFFANTDKKSSEVQTNINIAVRIVVKIKIVVRI